MVRPPARNTLIKCDVRLNASQNRFRTQITNRCLGLMTSYTVGVSTLTRDWYFIISASIWRLFVHFSSSTAFGALTGPHLHLFSSDLITASWHSPIFSSLFAALTTESSHWQSSTSMYFIHKCAESQVCIIQQKAKTADVDKWSGSTVNAARALAYMCTLCMCPRMCIHLDVFRFVNLCGCAQVSTRGLWGYILQMQIREHPLEAFLPAVSSYGSLPNLLCN